MSVLVRQQPGGPEIRFGLRSVDQVFGTIVEVRADSSDEEGQLVNAWDPSTHPEAASTEDENIAVRIRTFDLDATHIISSPYPDFSNHLRLQPLDVHSRLLAFALTFLSPVTSKYATTSYLEAFNWATVFSALRSLCHREGVQWREQSYYVVIFRSLRRRDADPAWITQLDQQSHREASESGGLLKYWFGSCDAEMRNLATCLWRNRADAAAGGRGPWHLKARNAARAIYEKIEFRTHRLVIGDGAETWHLEEYVD